MINEKTIILLNYSYNYFCNGNTITLKEKLRIKKL